MSCLYRKISSSLVIHWFWLILSEFKRIKSMNQPWVVNVVAPASDLIIYPEFLVRVHFTFCKLETTTTNRDLKKNSKFYGTWRLYDNCNFSFGYGDRTNKNERIQKQVISWSNPIFMWTFIDLDNSLTLFLSIVLWVSVHEIGTNFFVSFSASSIFTILLWKTTDSIIRSKTKIWTILQNIMASLRMTNFNMLYSRVRNIGRF